MSGFRNLVPARVQEAVRRSYLLRALVVYVSLSWGVLQGIDFAVDRLGLPDWVFAGTVALVVLGLPVIFTTAFVLGRRVDTVALAPAGDGAEVPPGAAARGRSRLTWRRLALYGLAAFAVWGLLVGAYVGARSLGIGPVGTLLAAGVLQPHDRILLAQFENRGGDPLLAGTLGQALGVALSQSRVVQVVEPGEVSAALQRMAREPGTPLVPELARELAVREGIKAVLEGDVAAIGAATLLTVRLVSAADGSVLVSAQQQARTPEELLGAVERLASRLRDRIGESLRVIRSDPPLAQVTTTSLAALRAYSQAERAYDVEGDEEKARLLLEDALAIDSTFAMAWRKLGIVLIGVDPERQEQAITNAYRLRQRLPERERHHATAAYHYFVTRDLHKAEAAYDAMIEVAPGDHRVFNNLGLVREALQDFAGAESAYRQAAALLAAAGRESVPLYINLSYTLVNQGRFAEAAATHRRIGELAPDHPGFHAVGVVLAAAEGDHAAAEERARARLEHLGQVPVQQAWAYHNLGVLAATQGRLGEAERQLRAAVRTAESIERPGFALLLARSLAELELLRGRPERARSVLRVALQSHALALSQGVERPYLELADTYARLGDAAEARRLYTAFKQAGMQAPEGLEQRVLGLIALAEGNTAEAITRLQSAARIGCVICALPDLGMAFEAAGQRESAIAAYDRFVTAPSADRLQIVAWHLGPAHERLVALHEQRGDPERAALHAARLSALWERADPELRPRVERVRPQEPLASSR